MINNIKEFNPLNISNLNFRLSVFLTYNCNYNCSYCCNKNLMKTDNNYLDFNYIIDLYNKIKKIRNYELKLTGGEPTLYPELENLLSLFINDKIILYTNGSMNISQYEHFIKKYPNLYYYISFHKEYSDIDKYKELVNLFNRLDFKNYEISLLMSNYNDIDILNKLNGNIIPNIISSNDIFIDNRYSYKIKLNNENEYIINESDMKNYYLKYNNIFKGMKCLVNKYDWALRPDESYNLHCGTNNCWFLKYNVKDFNSFYKFIYNKEYLICNSEECSCSSFWRYKKWK